MTIPEWLDIQQTGGFRPAPPSNQGKWFAEWFDDVTAWAKQFYQPTGQRYHIIEVDVPDDVVAKWYRDAKLDTIGPAVYAAVDQLAELNSAMSGLREIAAGP
jgi:hypothetical protein